MSTEDKDNADQLKEITESIISMAALDFNSPPPINGSGPLDAVAAGLIALAEELKATVVAREEAEHANSVKAQFLANMSHELRTPLTSIIGGMELMAQSGLSQSQRAVLTQMQSAGEQLFHLIDDVLDFSKINAGKLRFEREELCLRDTITGIIAQYSKQAEAKGLALVSNHHNLPRLSLLGDKQRIAQVINNLVGNAIKYTTKGKVSVKSRIHIQGSTVGFHVEVLDTGHGVEPKDQERIFQRFNRGDSSNQRRQNGAGLGLSIAKAIAQQMNGELTLKKTSPLGSCFSFSINLELAHRHVKTALKEEYIPSLHHRVLLVEDTEMVRLVTGQILEGLGCEVVTATTGKEAIRIVENENFDLILMDCQMPEMDGLEASRRLFKLYPERGLRIAALTAHASLSDVERSEKAGMLGHLNKPFTINEIKTFIQQLDEDYPPHQN
jgi:two-component system, sensor histidine kinase